MTEFCYILDASSLEKGIGNIKRWCEPATNARDVHLSLYIPSFTLQELDFLRYRRNSATARESLRFLDQTDASDRVDVIIEFTDLLDAIPWSDVLEHQVLDVPELDARSGNGPASRPLPRRFKNLLKSCVYKCHLEGSNQKSWTLVTEDPTVCRLAHAFQIPVCSLVEADNCVSKSVDRRSFEQSVRFNKNLKRRTVKEISDGKEVYKAKFDDTVYAPRGAGELWAP
ncbi:LAFE_0E06766g1_1 [Lachancea fermentati]|uniref:LAFE_0E06766g1_1 n=1 Tax=Lachancea fermentati TaxID=4955 RepID=A0A1G4MDB7_LACFM|nr:LAFE_0E06766g1_1 [Lachancea fermentati]